MKYIYQAKRGPSEAVEGLIEAPNQDMAIARLIDQGLVPILVEEESEHLLRKETRVKQQTSTRLPFGRKVSKRHIYFFTKQMRALLRSHVPILNSLYILENQAANVNLKEVIQSVIGVVREGATFSESIGKFPQYFSSLYVSIIKAGEAGGKLDCSFEQIAKYMEREMRLSQQVKSSLAYPAVMIGVGITTVIFLITFVIPKLTVLFEDLTDELPVVTRVLLSVSRFFSHYWPGLIGVIVLFGIFLYYTKNSAWQRKTIDIFKKRLPVVKSIIYNQSLSRLARGLSILLSSGVSIAESIRIAAPLINDDTSQAELEDLYTQILSGTGLEESLKKTCSFLPDIFIKMVAVGESSGRLDETLGEMADDYADSVEAETKIMTSLIEPVAILVVGGILGLIVIAVLLPIFEMSFLM